MTTRLQPFLRGPLVALRPLRASDWDALYAVARDPLLWEQHPNPDRWQESVFQVFFREALDSAGALVVVEAATGRVIGSSQYRWYDEAGGVIQIGWTFLARDRWGGGTNREVKRLMVDHALGFASRVVFFVGLGNVRSQRALEKIGAIRVGFERNPAGRESVRFELTAASWAQP